MRPTAVKPQNRSYRVSNAARSFGRRTLVALAVFAPALLLAGCGKSTDEQVADQVAVAKQAADRAEAAQKAAEKAAKAVIAQAPPGNFGSDEGVTEFSESNDFESTEPTDSTGGMDDSGDSGGGSTSGVPD